MEHLIELSEAQAHATEPSRRNNHTRTPEQNKPESQDTNLFIQLRPELLHLAGNTGNLSEAIKTELFTFITRPPHFLTWALDDTWATFLHHAFAANHTPLINELVKLPQWDALSKTENIRNKKGILENTTPIIPLFEERQVSQSLVTLGIFATTADESQSFIRPLRKPS